jgi:hypothetical protein
MKRSIRIISSEEGKAKILALKREEVSADKYNKDVIPLWHGVKVSAIQSRVENRSHCSEQDSVRALLAVYPTGVEDLFPRRSNAINAASEMRSCLRSASATFPDPCLVRSNSNTRSDALAECVETADSQLHRSKLDEMVLAIDLPSAHILNPLRTLQTLLASSNITRT